MMLTKMYANCAAFLHSLKKDERGVTAIEYAIVGVAIAGIVATVFATGEGEAPGGALQEALTDAFAAITNIITNVTPKAQ